MHIFNMLHETSHHINNSHLHCGSLTVKRLITKVFSQSYVGLGAHHAKNH